MRRATGIALVIGLAGMVAVVVYAGAGQVARALESLRFTGLLLLMLLHLPIEALMGLAWRLTSGEDPPATRSRFVWARLVRDAAAETLPFLQLGGIVLGVRALGSGRSVAVRGAVAATVDGVVELAAKLPYVAAALAALLVLVPHSSLARPLLIALLATAVLAAIPVLGRKSIGGLLERAVRTLSRRVPAILSLDEGTISDEVRGSYERIFRQRGRLAAGFVLHLICWYLGAVEAWVTLHLVGVNLSWVQALALDGTVMALRTFGVVVPAAAGVQEASYLLAAAVLGIPAAPAIAAALARRARDLALGVTTLGLSLAAHLRLAVLTVAGLLGSAACARALTEVAVPGSSALGASLHSVNVSGVPYVPTAGFRPH